MLKKMGFCLFLSITVILTNVVTAADRHAEKSFVEHRAVRCVLCHLGAAMAGDYRVVWCLGPGCLIKIYPSLEEVLRKESQGHCVHFICLQLWLQEKNHCPICRKKFSALERIEFEVDAFVSDEFEGA